MVSARSIRRGIAVDLAAALAGDLRAARVESGTIGGQAAAAGPGPEPLDRLARGHGHRDDVLRRLHETDAEQVGRLAAGLDLGAGPLAVRGTALIGIEP